MFGSPCAFVNGNLATGLFGAGWFVRLDEAEAGTLLGFDGAGSFSPMPSRPWVGYVLLPDALSNDDDAIRTWLDRSVAFVATLPAKPAKASKPPKASRPRTSGARAASAEAS
jgi:hypothetical protein